MWRWEDEREKKTRKVGFRLEDEPHKIKVQSQKSGRKGGLSVLLKQTLSKEREKEKEEKEISVSKETAA